MIIAILLSIKKIIIILIMEMEEDFYIIEEKEKESVANKPIQRGTVVIIYCGDRQMPMEAIVGIDILRSKDVYKNRDGKLYVSETMVDNAILEYMECSVYANDYYTEFSDEVVDCDELLYID
jgi:hypothetical protein